MIEKDVLLSKFSYYRIGGVAKYMATPKTFEDLAAIQKLIAETGLPYFILGWGSNLLFADEGYDGIIIRMKHLFANDIEVKAPGVLRVGASVGCSSLLRKAQEKGWGKLAHFTGIPGSIGGMVAMNAGTHLGEMKDSCISVETIRFSDALNAKNNLPIHQHVMNEKSFSYRHSHFLKSDELVLHAELKFEPEDPATVRDEIEFLYQRRKQSQPVDYPSCGSVFMNPKGLAGDTSTLHAWQVIDKLGLRGHIIGGAQFSEKHSNFIINLGQAKAADVKALIALAKKRAQDELGIELKEEVRVL